MPMANNNTLDQQMPIEEIMKIFDQDKFYVKLFKNLLTAVTHNDFSILSRTPSELTYLYFNLRSKVEKFIMSQIYENIYTSRAYDGLISSLIDIYTVIHTVIYLRANITEVNIQPDEVIDAYLDSFGFKAKHLFNYIQRREICKVVYWYLRRKGTPALIIKLLDMLNFTYFYICEFDICKTGKEHTVVNTLSAKKVDDHVYVPRLLYEELPKHDSIGFFSGIKYNYSYVRNEDPPCIATDQELSEKVNMSFPAQSPYYQVGVAVTYTEMERMIAAFTYAMIRKTLIDMDMGEDVYTSKVRDYNGRVSFISLVLGWTYLLGECFGIHDNYLYEELTLTESYDFDDLKYDLGNAKYDQGDISRRDILYAPKDRLNPSTGYDGFPSTKYDGNAKYDTLLSNDNETILEGNRLYRLKYPVFGWQKDVANQSPVDIMYDIEREIKRLCKRVLWQPSIPEHRLVGNGNKVVVKGDTILTRKKDALKEIKEIFYGAPIFGTYNKAIKFFKEHDPKFKLYLDNLLIDKDTLVQMGKDGRNDDIDDYFNTILDAMDAILESIEYYIFDKTTFMIPVRHYILSYDKIIRILNELDRYYAPYHAKLLDPMVVWLIRDLPGDCVAIDDTKMTSSSKHSMRDVVWRASHYSISDIAPPEPYDPISDFGCDNPNMPHIPVSPDYKVPPYHDRKQLQKDNNYLYAVGYDWTNLDQEPFIVRSECLTPIYDFDPDLIKLDQGLCKTHSGFNIVKPDHEMIDQIKKYYEELDKKICDIDSYAETIVGDNIKDVFTIEHNLANKDVIVQVYDIMDGSDVSCLVKRIDQNIVELHFNDILQPHQKYRVVIICRMIRTSIHIPVASSLINIIGNNKIKNFMAYHNLGSNDTICEVYDRIEGDMVGSWVRRINSDTSYISFNVAPNNNRTYRANIFTPLNPPPSNPLQYKTLEQSFVVSEEGKNSIKLKHNFYCNNIVSQLYNDVTGETIDCQIIHLNNHEIQINLKHPMSFMDRYRLVLIGSLNRAVSIAIPLNNLTAFTGTIDGDGNCKSFHVRHNLNTTETIEQIVHKVSGEAMRAQFEHIDDNTTRISFGQPVPVGTSYIISIIAPLHISKLTKPSTYYNTHMDKFTIEGDGTHKTYKIHHKFNMNPIMAQIYDKDGNKVNCQVRTVDKDTCEFSFHDPIPRGMLYTANILSLPNPSEPLRKIYDTTKVSMIDMHREKLLGNGKNKSFTIKHKMDTRTVIVGVYDLDNMETIECDIQVKDINTIDLHFKKAPLKKHNYMAMVIGALPITTLIDDFTTIDEFGFRPPHHYREVKTHVSTRKTIHKSVSLDHLDVKPEYVRDYYDLKTLYNMHKLDVPSMMERVDIIHEVRAGDASTTDTDVAGFNYKGVLTNDKYWNRESVRDIIDQQQAYKFGLGGQ